jgi:hypothetical protein
VLPLAINQLEQHRYGGSSLDNLTVARLLGSIEAGNLVLLCGAGLSIAAPSAVLSAVSVSRACYDRHFPIEQLDPALRDDVDALAGHFYGNGQFASLFINRLVPWDDLVGDPNLGHAAVGDFLITRSIYAALSANFDTLIERWCESGKVSLRGALDGAEATAFVGEQSALLKFHGCMTRGKREDTLWTHGQLAKDTVQQRVSSCRAWMDLNLPGKDLLVIGFWTDWGYLNDVLEGALANSNPGSVTVIDPTPTGALSAKAPALWHLLSRVPIFVHAQETANDALSQLRLEFSRVWVRRMLGFGRPMYTAAKGQERPTGYEPAVYSMDEIYEVRRDAEGRPAGRAARLSAPTQSTAAVGLAHLLLDDAATARIGSWYEVGGRSVRVVQGAGEGISTVQSRFKEPSSTKPAEIVICAGSIDQGVPARIVSDGRGASVVRPTGGGLSKWMTLDQATAELKI